MDPTFQLTDQSTHVQNCSNHECILPTCVNWKLNIAKTSLKRQQQHKKRDWSTVSDVRHKKEKLQHDQEIDEATALFFEDLEEFMKRDLGKTPPSCLATDIDAKNSFSVSQNIPGCNQLHIGANNDVELMLNSQQQKSYKFAQSPSDTELAMVPTGISLDQLTGRSLKTQSFPLEMEKLFIPFGDFPYQRPSSRMTATTATTKATEELPFFCSLRDSKLPQEDENKLKNQASIIQPTNAKRLWGILAQILKIIEEGSVSEDSEAFCVKVLQKALAELQLRFLPQKRV